MLTYIYCDGDQIARYGDAIPLRINNTIYLDDNRPYLVTAVRLVDREKAQYVDVQRELTRPTPPHK